METKDTEFELRAYGWKELAALYNPYVAPNTTTKRLSDWVRRNPRLEQELFSVGWQKGYRVLTPMQVEVLVRHLGEP